MEPLRKNGWREVRAERKKISGAPHPKGLIYKIEWDNKGCYYIKYSGRQGLGVRMMFCLAEWAVWRVKKNDIMGQTKIAKATRSCQYGGTDLCSPKLDDRKGA